jgi:hypothetical protein
MKCFFFKKLIVIGSVAILLFAFFYLTTPTIFSTSYTAGSINALPKTEEKVDDKKEFVATHLETPDKVKGIYMTACVAGTPSFRQKLVSLIEETELNSVVIDIKDYSGSISFSTEDNRFSNAEHKGCFIIDLRDFIASLHRKRIYVIGRVTVFQDPITATKRPDLAVQKKSDNSVWKDYKGLSYIDVGAREYWDYIVALARASYSAGFDEINFDYIRFPSDGNMQDIYFPWSEENVVTDPDLGKAEVLKEFFAYLDNELYKEGIVRSADLFGMSTTNKDDLNIGQILEYALPYFDYIAPMVYPSHYPKNFIGLSNPATNPYTVVKYSLDKAFARASTTSQKIRPWLQDFDLGAVYTPEMVRTQIQATYDAGFDSWMLWDAANTYTSAALLKNDLDVAPAP